MADHLFRRRYGRMVAALTRRLGSRHLDLAEEAVQEALVRALRHWPFVGVPDDPEAWLLAVARRRAVDLLRRDGRWSERSAQVEEHWYAEAAVAPPSGSGLDDELALLFLAAHPILSLEDRVILSLKTVGGLSVQEIARALLKKPASVAQRLVRAKARLRRSGARFQEPSVEEMAGEMEERLPAVLSTLHLMFNEGHTASHGDDLLRPELCREAIRLTGLLTQRPETARPEVDALLALFWFLAARFTERTDPDGHLLPLHRQDRSLWDRRAIALGVEHLARSARGDQETGYHLEAALAAAHSTAPSFADTDWRHILELYDRLLARTGSPIVALNRVVALAEVEGAEAGLAELHALEGLAKLDDHHLRWAVEADLLRRVGDRKAATAAYGRAVERANNARERDFLLRRHPQVAGTTGAIQQDRDS